MIVRCPKCKGDKFSVLANGMFKCSYCGHVYDYDDAIAENNKDEAVEEEKAAEINTIEKKEQIAQKTEEQEMNTSNDNNKLWIGLLTVGALAILLFFYWGLSKSSSKDAPIETDVELVNMSSDSQSHYYAEENISDETESKEENNTLSEGQDEEDSEKMIYTIKERITNIYKKAFADRFNAEELFMTDDYNRYYRKITRYETEINEPLLWDSDHWTLSQDPLNPHMEILDVIFPDDNTADVSIRIIDYDGNKINNVLLKMVYERNDWYIDDMIKSGYSEKQEMKNCIREYNID